MFSNSMKEKPVTKSLIKPVRKWAALGSERGGPHHQRQPESSQPLVEVGTAQLTASIAKGTPMEVEREWPNSATNAISDAPKMASAKQVAQKNCIYKNMVL